MGNELSNNNDCHFSLGHYLLSKSLLINQFLFFSLNDCFVQPVWIPIEELIEFGSVCE